MGAWSKLAEYPKVDTFVALILGCFAAHTVSTLWAKRSLPPGPWPLPVWGNFHQLLKEGLPHRALQQLHARYGPLLTLWYGNTLTIVLGSPRIVQQTHREQGEKFQHRFLTSFAKLSLKADEEGGKNVALSGGKYWTKARKVFVQELMSKKFIERDCVPKIMEEIWSTVDAVHALGGQPFDPHEHLQRLSCNIVFRLTYGIRFPRGDIGNVNSDWGQLHDIINSIMALGGQNVMANYSRLHGLLEKCSPAGRDLNRRRHRIVETRDRILERLLQDHRRQLRPEAPRDFLDVLLTRQERDGLSDLEVMYIAWEFITAGTDTTSATIHWLLLLLADHPAVQGKAQAEIDEVCKGRPVSVQDETSLPYVNACIKECMRWMPVVPLMVPYKASADAEVDVDGRTYLIRKGTQVVVNGFNMHRDSSLWDNADEFNPDRFMQGPDADIELRGADAPNDPHHLKFLPLGTGRRACAGYLLAKTELFLQGATLMQCFRFRPAYGQTKVSFKERFGIAVSAGHFDIEARWRPDSRLDLEKVVAQFGAHA